MIEWIRSNLGSIIILLLLISGIMFFICNFIKQKKQGKRTCLCGCENCSISNACNKIKSSVECNKGEGDNNEV